MKYYFVYNLAYNDKSAQDLVSETILFLFLWMNEYGFHLNKSYIKSRRLKRFVLNKLLETKLNLLWILKDPTFAIYAKKSVNPLEVWKFTVSIA